MSSSDHSPVEMAAPARYEHLNVFGLPTGRVIVIANGSSLPPLPRGFAWRLVQRPLVSEMSHTELLVRAIEYRQIASTATTTEVRDALLRIAERFAVMAQERAAK
jgi:hypothetical protein